jgi:hypothetical protein
MYDVDLAVWVKVATMHFEGPAAWWLQSVDHRVHSASWIELCSWIHGPFSHDQHELLIRHLYRIKQSGSVQDYIDKFCELVDQLQAYSRNTDPLYYTTRVIDGLHDDIKYYIAVQRPKDLDTAWCPTLLQEENNNSHVKEPKRMEASLSSRAYMKGPLPLPRPPLQSKENILSKDRGKSLPQKSQSLEDKFTALTAYKMAKGLCKKMWRKVV